MSESISPEEFVAMARNEVNRVDDTRLYYTMKKLRLRVRLGSQSFLMLKGIVALHNLGIDAFSVSMVTNVVEIKFYDAAWANLHMLGDNHVLIKLRGLELDKSVWKLSPVFLNVWDGKDVNVPDVVNA